ncbi:SMAD/FHA domain-containing protein [Trametes coccinea BRFM310]|uniref:SMAD/FHA domain-containing protein n=1 Tax=Trametes coccinea (strain BRFM310) TaxID=1353009 RepID=A0A1Y2J3E4_TRAC3|nr:SMAD/FHA domain-containing protein [Trametes coccinea BRFM310]
MDPVTIGEASPSARQSILGSFLRGRPRGTSQSHPSPPHDQVTTTRDSPPPAIPSVDHASGHRRRPAAASSNLQASVSQSNSTPGFSQMLRRRRSAGTVAAASSHPPAVAVARTVTGPPAASSSNSNGPSSGTGPAHRIRLVPHLDSRRSLRFDPISRDVREGDPPLRIGRFTDRSGLGLAAANAMGSNKLAFKSKVVSRAHAEIWVEAGGRFFIRDTKSSSGTFLNHVRLSPANNESRPHELKDGDLLQLGVDYQGGTEDIYKCVKIKVEVGREWQNHTNPFNANAFKQLKAIAIPQQTASGKKVAAKSALPDCCICLFGVTIHQALFIAPCSHAFHYKCIRPLLESHHPAFSCPLCRTYADLEEDVEVEIDQEYDTNSVAEASAAMSAVAVALTPAGDRPNTGDGSSRERERERDVGAETEVEVDTGASRLGAGLRARRIPPSASAGPNTPRMPTGVVTEDVDAEMEDMVALPPLPESTSVLAIEQEYPEGDRMVDVRENSGSPVPIPGPARANGRGTPGAYSEGEFEVEGGSSDGSGNAIERASSMPGKRKR